MIDPEHGVPDEEELADFYEEVGKAQRPEYLIEQIMDDPLDVAKKYYHEDNRPVLYEPGDQQR